MSSSENLLTEGECYKILNNYAYNEKVLFKSHLMNILPSVEGFLGKHYKLEILYEQNGAQKTVNLFVKMLNTKSVAVQYIIESIRAWEKEEFFYNYLINEFYSHGIRNDFAPKCYYYEKNLFVLEDVSLKQYKNSIMKEMLDVKHCKVALKTLAHFHASTLFYEKIKRDTDSNFTNLQKLYPKCLDDALFAETKNGATEWLECTITGLLALIDILPEAEISADCYKSKLLEALEDSKSYREPSRQYINTVLHGDLWSNNFMFKYENNIPVNSVLIDYQILKYGPMALDVVQMIFTNVRRCIREVQYEELLSYYYHQFVEICEEHGFTAHEFISYKDFMQSCDEAKIVSKIQCVSDHSITFLIGKEVEEAFKSEENIRNFLLEDRSKTMILSYRENDLFREIMTEDLIELRDMLFET